MKRETVDNDSSSRNKSASNLNFTKWGSHKKEAVPADSRARDRRNFQDLHVDMVDKADQDQSIVQSINSRVQNKQSIHAPTKFTNFSRQQDFTTPGKKGSNPAKHTSNGGEL